MFCLAQVNIAIAKDAMDSKVIQEFADNLDPINALAEGSDGFIWRLKDEAGNATDIPYSDNPNELVNMSVWQSVEALKQFMFKTQHLDFLKRKKEWFEIATSHTYALWWVPAGHYPTIQEAKDKLAILNSRGESAQVFTFKKVFDAPSIVTE